MSSPPPPQLPQSPPSLPPLPNGMYYRKVKLQELDGTPVYFAFPEHFSRNGIPAYYRISRKGDYYIFHSTGRKPGQPVRSPLLYPSRQQPSEAKDPSSSGFWASQTFQKAEKENTNSGTDSPKKLTIWEKHAARKQAQAMEKALKEKESRVVHSNYPPPPKLSLIPAFRAYQNNSAEKKKANESSGQQHKQFDVSSFQWMITFTMYEFIIGAVGGIVMGVEAGTIIQYKNLPTTPNTISPAAGVPPTPVPIIPRNIRYGWTAFRVLRRGMFAGLLFGILEQQLKEARNRADWKNSTYSGFICGGIFGLRGGPRIVITSALAFSGFASIAALTKHILPPLK